MSIEVVVAGRVGTRIVGRLLANRRCCSAGVRAAENRSDGIMYASSLLSGIEGGVVLVLDADTLETGPLHEQRTTVEYLTRRSSVETGFRLVLAVPQVEAVLFHDRAGLERALGRRMADEDAFEGRFRPKAVFRRLAGEGAEHDAPFVEEDADGNVVLRDEMEERALAVIDALDEAALARMATHPIIREIAEFVAEVEARGGYEEPVPVRRAG